MVLMGYAKSTNPTRPLNHSSRWRSGLIADLVFASLTEFLVFPNTNTSVQGHRWCVALGHVVMVHRKSMRVLGPTHCDPLGNRAG